MAKSRRHKRHVAKKAERAHQQAKVKAANTPTQWTRDPSWRNRKEPTATFYAIFNTFELLEHVLSHLPTPDLFQAQSVSFKMKSTIEQSPVLKRRLFLQPDHTHESLWKVNRKRIKTYDSPIETFQAEVEEYLDHHTGREIRIRGNNVALLSDIRIPKIINPLVLDILPETDLDWPNTDSLVDRMLHNGPGWSDFKEKIHFRLDIRDLLADSKARTMFVTQPPTKQVVVRCSNQWCLHGRDLAVSNANGITVEALVAAWQSPEYLHEPELGPNDVQEHPPPYDCARLSMVELELLDGFAVTEAEWHVVNHGNQKATSRKHSSWGAFRGVYPYSFSRDSRKIVPTLANTRNG